MLAEDLPVCLCGAHSYEGGGGRFGGDFSSSWFSCSRCNRRALNISASGFTILLMDAKHEVFLDEDSDPLISYANEVLLPFWRAEAEKVGGKKRVSPTPPALPQKLEAFHLVFAEKSDERGWRFSLPLHGKKNEEGPSYTPKDNLWIRVHHGESLNVPMPEDPIKVRHRELFQFVFKELDVKWEDVEQIPNQYYEDRLGNEPWFKFEHKGVDIVLGPRKRVFSIKVHAPRIQDEMIHLDSSTIREAAEKDNTTFISDGIWKPDSVRAHQFEVHAWGREKLLEYVRIIFNLIDKSMS